MGIIGAILGDIAGSKWEYTNNRNRLFTVHDIFEEDSYFTDDTVMSIATMEAVENNGDFACAYRKWGNKYPDAGYGPSFIAWINNENMGPYNSLGNGSAMRASYIGEKYKNDDSDERVIKVAEESARVTHNHPEGIKGAVTLAKCVWLAEKARYVTKEDEKMKIKEEILKYGIEQYPKDKYKYGCNISVNEYKNTMYYDVTCMGSVPVAIRSFYDTNSFEECMKLICSMDCDADTVGAIAGAICESYYGYCVKDKDVELLKNYLDDDLYKEIYKYIIDKNIIQKLGYGLAAKKLVNEKLKVNYMYREEPDNEYDSGWRFF